MATLSKREIASLTLGAAIVVLLTMTAFKPYGSLRLTFDSYDLIAASESFDTYLNGTNAEGHSYLVRAPLHPFLLSFFENKMLALWWINLICLIGSLVVIFKLCRAAELSITWSVLSPIVTISLYPWLMNFQFFWTEGVFILLILALTYMLAHGNNVMLTFVICALLFFTRKPGIFFFVAAAAVYVIDRRWRSAAFIFFGALIIFLLWQWLEYSHQSTGYFGIMLDTLDQYKRVYYLEAITTWFLPREIPGVLRYTLFCVVAGLAFYYFRSEIFSVFDKRQNLVLLTVPLVYSFIFISFSGATGYEDAERYLNVVFPLWSIALTCVAAKIYSTGQKSVRFGLVVILSLWLVYPFLRTAHHLF